MKKFIAIAMLTLLTACAQPEGSGMMDKGMMCDKCPCCQKMMEGGMKMDGMKSGMQCPMMKNGTSKDGMKCSCCQGMMKDGMMQKQSMPSTPKTDDAHKKHHPVK